MNVLELRPARMDDSGRTKYPVLFRVYGGPGSQLVSARFGVDWHWHLASALQYVVVVVDGRGTGFRGRAFRSVVRGNLGANEVADQVHAAKCVRGRVRIARTAADNGGRLWAAKDYVDPKRIGIWGWVRPGAPWCLCGLTSRAVLRRIYELEGRRGQRGRALARNGGCRKRLSSHVWQITRTDRRLLAAGHELATVWYAADSVGCARDADETDTRLDSVYTERYMGLPATNAEGYVNASIANVSAFGAPNMNYLLAHGSGDDNVHFANSAHLLDMFTRERVRGFRFRMFTDRCVRPRRGEAAQGRRWPGADVAGSQRPLDLDPRRVSGRCAEAGLGLCPHR
jgi:dipeptidyl aminopeptidase